MTTPNKQPTPPNPPEGYRLSYGEPFTLFQGVKWLAMNGWFDIPECRIGCEAYHRTFYAVPITPTVPATGDKTLIQAYVEKHGTLTPRDTPTATGDKCPACGTKRPGRCIAGIYIPVCQHDSVDGFISGDTTNEKGGEPCAESSQTSTGPNTPSLTPASNAAVAVPSHDQRQELLPCPFCGASDWKQDDDISDWRVLTHKPECFLAEDKLGRTRQEIISLPNKEAQQWNTRK